MFHILITPQTQVQASLVENVGDSSEVFRTFDVIVPCCVGSIPQSQAYHTGGYGIQPGPSFAPPLTPGEPYLAANVQQPPLPIDVPPPPADDPVQSEYERFMAEMQGTAST